MTSRLAVISAVIGKALNRRHEELRYVQNFSGRESEGAEKLLP